MFICIICLDLGVEVTDFLHFAVTSLSVSAIICDNFCLAKKTSYTSLKSIYEHDKIKFDFTESIVKYLICWNSQKYFYLFFGYTY